MSLSKEERKGKLSSPEWSKRQRNLSGEKEGGLDEATPPPQHPWWNGVYNPYSTNILNSPHHYDVQSQPSYSPTAPQQHDREVYLGEWGKYRRQKSFLDHLGGW